MRKTAALFIGLALAVSAFVVSAQQAPKGGQTAPAGPPCQVGKGPGPGPNCPYYGYCPGQGQGQQHRYGWGKGQGQGQGKGFRGGPRDGSGPRRDGSCGQCPKKS